jgi:hypothetical protein
MKNRALAIGGTIFLLIAIIHLVRLFHPFELIIGGYNIPLWGNGIGFIVFGMLSAFMFYAFGENEKNEL